MKLRNIAPLAAFLMGACTSAPPPETLKNLYEVESAARQMKPQPEMALLYLVSTESTNKADEVSLRINGEMSMKKGFFEGQFYVFCLPAGKYDITYRADLLSPNKQEFLTAEAGGIYVRDFSQHVFALPPFIFLSSSTLKERDLKVAKELIAAKHIGSEPEYIDSRYRCRSLN